MKIFVKIANLKLLKKSHPSFYLNSRFEQRDALCWTCFRSFCFCFSLFSLYRIFFYFHSVQYFNSFFFLCYLFFSFTVTAQWCYHGCPTESLVYDTKKKKKNKVTAIGQRFFQTNRYLFCLNSKLEFFFILKVNA